MKRSFQLFACAVLPTAFALTTNLSYVAGQSDVAKASSPAGDVNAVHATMVTKGLNFLRKSQLPDGSFSTTRGPGITGLLLSSMLSSGLQPGDPMVDKALAYLLQSVRDNGGIYAEGSVHANYETCLAISALAKLNAAGSTRA